MSGFSADWLARREASDRRARSVAVLAAVSAAFSGSPSVAVVDLACGAGATMRALSPRLPSRQSWLLVDNDAALLANAAKSAADMRLSAAIEKLDIAANLSQALERPADLLTASALLDLVSREWMTRLAKLAVERRLPVYAALTYDGRVTLHPADPLDAAILEAVNRHQRGDKGFGPALGPTAAPVAIDCFGSAGYAVMHGAADWALEPSDGALQADLVAGWAAAAIEINPSAADEIAGWRNRRLDHVARGRSSMRVGHTDFFARPMGAR